MTYSCSDFTDDVLNCLEGHGIIDGAKIRDDDPESQMYVARAAINRLVKALRECVTDNPGAACYNTGRKTRRLEAINAIVKEALQ